MPFKLLVSFDGLKTINVYSWHESANLQEICVAESNIICIACKISHSLSPEFIAVKRAAKSMLTVKRKPTFSSNGLNAVLRTNANNSNYPLKLNLQFDLYIILRSGLGYWDKQPFMRALVFTVF